MAASVTSQIETTKKIINSILTIYCHKGRNILKQFSYASYILPE
jgi:hypothetical protein